MKIWPDASRVANAARQRQRRITKAAVDAASRAEARRIRADRAEERAAELTAVQVKRGNHPRPAAA